MIAKNKYFLIFCATSVGLTLFALINSPKAFGDSVLVTPTSPEQTTTLTQRLSNRESTYKSGLGSVDRSRISNRCTLAQTALATLKTQDTTVANNRKQTYTNLANTLDTIISNLGRQSIDATELTFAQTKFNNAVNTYLQDAEDYKASMDDAVVMDCIDDPVGFEASILAARAERAQLAKDAVAIKAVVPQVQTTLTSTKQALIKKSGVSTSQDNQ